MFVPCVHIFFSEHGQALTNVARLSSCFLSFLKTLQKKIFFQSKNNFSYMLSIHKTAVVFFDIFVKNFEAHYHKKNIKEKCVRKIN